MEGEIKTRVRPQAADCHNAIIDLAQGAQVLAGHVLSAVAGLAVPAIIDDEHSLLVRSRARLISEQLQAAGIYRLAVPGRLGKEVLELLHTRMLGFLDRSGPSQAGESLVPVSGQQQALEIAPEGF